MEIVQIKYMKIVIIKYYAKQELLIYWQLLIKNINQYPVYKYIFIKI